MRKYSSSGGRLSGMQVMRRLLQALTAAITLAGVFSFMASTSASASAASPKPAKLSIAPQSHQYGSVAVGASSASQSFAVTNTGQSASGPISVVVTGTDTADFVVDANSCTATLAAGGNCSVSVHFTPAAAGARTATLSVSGTPGGTVTSSLKGTGATAKLVLSPAFHRYGRVTIGAASDRQSYTVTNTGQAASGPPSVAISGPDAGDFTLVSSTCGSQIAAGSSCTVGVVFAPSAPGFRTATLTATASPGGSDTARLRGTGAPKALLAISPPTFDYGQVVDGATSTVESYTVTNSGLSASGKLTVALGGANAADFVLDSTTCGAKLAAGASCTVQVQFAPAAVGPADATVSATASPGGTATAALQGAGVTAAALSITPATFDFGQTPEGTSSGDQTFTVTNTGQATSGTVALSLSGPNADAFAIDSTTCGAALPGGGSCTVAVQFEPGSTGTLTASLSATAAPGGTATAALQGEGQAVAALSIDPTMADFGQTPIGVTSAASSFTVTNTGQAASGTVAVSLGGTNASYFTIQSSTCTAALAPGDSCTVTVTFDSFYTGTDTASLTATATPGGSASASLTAQAITPAYYQIPNPPNFGDVFVGASTPDQTLTVTDEGQQTTGTLHVALGGSDPEDYVIDSNTCTGTLASGASCSIAVHFSPIHVGDRPATLTVSSSPGTIATVQLDGTGVQTLNVSPASDAFGNQVEGTTTAAGIFTVTNYGATPLTFQTLTGTDAGNDFPVTADNCTGATLDQDASCTIDIAFDADNLGAHSSIETVQFLDPGDNVYQTDFTLSGTSVVPPPDLSTAASVASANDANATVNFTVTNLGSASSVPATMTIDVDPVQDFSYETGAGSDCTASFAGGFDSVLTCPVPVIAPGATYSRQLTIENLSGQTPKYVQVSATTIMPGDTNSSNNTGYATVTFG
jgi:hypothetical protein